MLQLLNQDWSVKYITFHLLNVTTLDDNFNFLPVFMFLTFMIFIIDVWFHTCEVKNLENF